MSQFRRKTRKLLILLCGKWVHCSPLHIWPRRSVLPRFRKHVLHLQRYIHLYFDANRDAFLGIWPGEGQTAPPPCGYHLLDRHGLQPILSRMANQLDELLALIAAMKPEDRDRLVRTLTGSGIYEVRDVDAPPYQPSKELRGMKSVIVTLPDDLATQAQAAGLLGAKRIEELIRRELRAEPARSAPPSSQQRKLVRHRGRLVVEALPNEEKIDTAEVRDLLNKMEW